MRSKKDIPVEEKSYAVLFFILSALLGIVTIWGFWSEAITRRPWKGIQQEFYQYEYEKTKIELERAKKNLPEISEPKALDRKKLNELENAVADAKVKREEALQERKFIQSESDAINYKYQHALHEAKAHEASGESEHSVEKWKKKLDGLESAIEGPLTQAVITAELKLSETYQTHAQFYETSGHLEDALSTYLLAAKYNPGNPEISDKVRTVRERAESLAADTAKHDAVARIEEKLHSLKGIKTFLASLLESPFTKTRTIVQYYIEDFDHTADRCATCHFAVDESGYDSRGKEIFEEIEGDGESKFSIQLAHPLVKVGSETVVIDEEEVEEDSYELSEDGQLTFADPDIYADVVEVAYETGYNPSLRTHPHRDVLLGSHPAERFGCTPCHGGQGQALTSKAAHALTHNEYWLTPVLGLDEHTGRSSPEFRGYMESNCRRCHDGVMMLDAVSPQTGETRDYAPNLTKGMALFEDLGCHGCHAVEGYSALDNIDKVGPSLAKIGSKVKGIEWLESWVKNPSAHMANTKMPSFFPNSKMTQLVYFKNGNKRTGVVTTTEDGIIVQGDDGTEFVYSDDAVEKVVDEVKSIAQYLGQLRDSAIEEVGATYSTSARAIATGEKVVKSVGCLSCHSVDGLGSDFAPELDNVGSKVTPNFLRQWISDPKSYDPDTAMPSLRLTESEVDNAVAYLMSLKGLTTVAMADSQYPHALSDPAEGEKLVRSYGCYGCHNIPGFENESKVGADLGEFGAKTTEEFDFGDTVGIEHSWHGWTIGKITNPRRYHTRRIVSRMPVFPIGEEDARALAVLLKSLQPTQYPFNYIHQPSEQTRQIDAGRRLAKKYNCTGCHEIEGKGGTYVDIIAAHEGLDQIQAKQFAPPTLQAQGAKVYPDWLFEFLKNPTPIRYGLKVRMPTFGLSDGDGTTLVKYFSSLSDEPFPYKTIALEPATSADLRVGKRIFDALECISCHPEQGEVIPSGSNKTGRPDLALAKSRLKADWIIEWLKEPQSFQPGTAMPQAWPKIGGEYQPVEGVAGDDAEKQIRLVRDYLISLAK